MEKMYGWSAPELHERGSSLSFSRNFLFEVCEKGLLLHILQQEIEPRWGFSMKIPIKVDCLTIPKFLGSGTSPF
jgi:hypothetical protein